MFMCCGRPPAEENLEEETGKVCDQPPKPPPRTQSYKTLPLLDFDPSAEGEPNTLTQTPDELPGEPTLPKQLVSEMSAAEAEELVKLDMLTDMQALWNAYDISLPEENEGTKIATEGTPQVETFTRPMETFPTIPGGFGGIRATTTEEPHAKPRAKAFPAKVGSTKPPLRRQLPYKSSSVTETTYPPATTKRKKESDTKTKLKRKEQHDLDFIDNMITQISTRDGGGIPRAISGDFESDSSSEAAEDIDGWLDIDGDSDGELTKLREEIATDDVLLLDELQELTDANLVAIPEVPDETTFII